MQNHKQTDLEGWTEVLSLFKKSLSDQEFNTWISPLQAEIVGAESIRVIAPNRYIAEWFEQKYSQRAQELLQQQFGANYTLLIESRDMHNNSVDFEQQTVGLKDRKNSILSANNKAKSTGLLPQSLFKNFVVGDNSSIANAAAQSVASVDGSPYKQLTLYGSTGIGKSHLMHAIGNQIVQTHPHLKLHYITANDFVTRMITAIRHNAMPTFNEFYANLDVFLMDDVQFLAGKKNSENAFFDAYEAIKKKGGIMVFTGDGYPRDIPTLSERIVNRLEHSLTLSIVPPNLETRAAILIQKSKEHGCAEDLREDVIFFMAECVRSDVRALEGLLYSVLAVARFSGVDLKDITVDFIKDTQKDKINVHRKPLTLERIINVVADYCHIPVSDIMSSRRQRIIVYPRQLSMYIAQKYTRQSVASIGKEMGGKDHTTVIHAVKRMRERIEKDEEAKKAYAHLKMRLGIYE